MFAPNTRAQHGGFTLVELLVAMVISLVVGLAALSSTQFFMGMQRQSTGLNAVVANTSNAFAALKYEAGQAGTGFFTNGALACATFNISKGATAVATAAPVVPVRLSVADKVPTIELYYATALESAGASMLRAETLSTAASTELATYLPVAVGQDVVLASADTGVPCSLKTITTVATSTDGVVTLGFGSAGARNQYAFTPVTYAAGDSVLLAGSLQGATFTLANFADGVGQLTMTRPLDGTSAVLAKNVVAMAVQYGVSDVSGSTISGWRYPLGYPSLASGAQDWSAPTATALADQVKALKVAVLVRSTQKDKKVNGACATTDAMPSLLGTVLGQAPGTATGLAADETITDAMTGDWQCYRYAETSIVVPLRNFVFGRKT